MIKHVDLVSDYGLIAGSLGAPPYALQQYIDAHNNYIAIQQMLDDALAEGVTDLYVKKVEFSLGYEQTNDSPSAGSGERLVKVRSNIRVYWQHTKIDVIFDSNNKSPYHTTVVNQAKPYELSGYLFLFEDTINTNFYDLHLKGEVYHRSFSDTDGGGGANMERWSEQTGAILLGSIGGNCNFYNVSGEGFTAGVILGTYSGTQRNNLLTVGSENYFRYYTKGYWNPTTGLVENLLGYYHTGWKTIDTVKNTASNIYMDGKFVEVSGNYNGYNTTPRPNSNNFIISFANETYTVLKTIIAAFNEQILLPQGARYVRLQFMNETARTTETWDLGLFAPTLIIPSFSDCEITGGNYSDCHRGAITNLPNRTHFHHNKLWHNGLRLRPDTPMFPDSTRYHINNEENWVEKLTISDNVFLDSPNSILTKVQDFICERNQFVNAGGVVILQGKTFNIQNNTFKGDYLNQMVALAMHNGISEGRFKRDITLFNNTVEGMHLVRFQRSDDQLNNTKIKILKNTIEHQFITLDIKPLYSDNITVEGNNFTLSNLHHLGFQNSLICYINNFNENTIDYKINPSVLSAPDLSRSRMLITNNKGVGNVIKDAYISSYLYSGNNTNLNQTYEGISFENCYFFTSYLSGTANNHQITTKNCLFKNTQLFTFFNNNDDAYFKSKMSFEDTKFVTDSFTNSFIRHLPNRVFTKGQEFEFEFVNCSINDDTVNNIKVVSGLGNQPYWVNVENCKFNKESLINSVSPAGKI